MLKHWTEEAIKASYVAIKAETKAQHKNYLEFIQQIGKDKINKWIKLAEELKIDLDLHTGRIRYRSDFEPLDLQAEICYIRHGKTEGNTEPRVYQGLVDYPENQLNEIGREQAVTAAEKMEEFVKEGKWGFPDLIVSSPLQRAQQTAQPFREKHKNLPFLVLPEVGEMKFGSWDNKKVVECPADDMCHLFYLEQNALVKAGEPHRVQAELWIHPEWLEGQTLIPSENFLECMQRQRAALLKVESAAKKILQGKNPQELRKPRVVIYGHSMAGAAVSLLLGFGKVDASGWLGFDGGFIMPNATPTLLIPQKREKQE